MTDQGPRRRPGVVARPLEDECLLYDEARGRIHVLNAVAGCVWNLCDGAHSLESMAEEVRGAYDVRDETAVTDEIGSVVAVFAGLDLLDLAADMPAA
jgi:hypothetical protein